MRVYIGNEQKEIAVTTVILEHDPTDIDRTKLNMFFCPRCRYPIVQFVGRVVTVMPGNIPVGLPLIHLCPSCKRLYNIQAVV